MKWETVRLGDIIDFSNGINFDKSAYTQGIKIVGVSDFGNLFSPNYDELSEVKSDIVKSKDLLKNGDIVFVRSNGNKELVGRCMLVKKLPYPVTYSGFCIRARINNPNSYNSVFLTYYFKSMFFRKLLSGSSVGANIQNLSQARLSNCTISIPHIQTQKRIADILSAYDDLIENNQRQIKLLEEAAQRLYKEWFVDLRFPGHEHTAIVDGVPEGWTYSEIDSVFSIRYGKTLPTSKISSTGKYPVYGANGIIGYYDEKNCDDYSVLITSRGNGSGDVLRTYDKESFITNNSFIVKALNENIGFSYTHQLMVHTDFKNIRTGSAQPQLTNNSISTLKIFIPSNTLIDHYCLSTDAIYKKIIVLLKQIRLATQARDRLLPKLMSGEMEV